MQSLNKVTLIGSVGKDPEIRTTSGGQKIASLSLATSERWKDKSTGEQKEQTEWSKIVVFNPTLANIIESMVQKGTRLYVEGSLKTRKWQNQQGQDVYTTEIVLNQFNGQIIILAGAKIVDNASENNITQPREEIIVTEIGDDIPF